jgi:hypothetical protein
LVNPTFFFAGAAFLVTPAFLATDAFFFTGLAAILALAISISLTCWCHGDADQNQPIRATKMLPSQDITGFGLDPSV